MVMNDVAFIANSLETAYKFKRVFDDLGLRVVTGSTTQTRSLIKPGAAFDLVIFEAIGRAFAHLGEICLAVDGLGIPLLVIVDAEGLGRLNLPVQAPSDFVVVSAGLSECTARVMRLLGRRGLQAADDVVTVDDMVINLNTYQVTVGGNPVDLTYLEYALLAFFARHPGRTFTRDTLLQEVWGFDYYGGSRTVDVHVRRIRAKLGPGLAEHLSTIRGVGYLWE